MNDTRAAIREHLFNRLASTAEKIRQGGVMNDEQLTAAFLGVAISVATSAFGAAQAAAWLRDAADQIENGDARLKGPIH